MKKALILFISTLWIAGAGYCLAAGQEYQTEDLCASPLAAECLPEELLFRLQELGIDPATLAELQAYVDSQQVSQECTQQVANVIKTFLFLLYDCGISKDQRTCLGSVADFITNVFFVFVYCQGGSTTTTTAAP